MNANHNRCAVWWPWSSNLYVPIVVMKRLLLLASCRPSVLSSCPKARALTVDGYRVKSTVYAQDTGQCNPLRTVLEQCSVKVVPCTSLEATHVPHDYMIDGQRVNLRQQVAWIKEIIVQSQHSI
jgi:hypothetical protein